LEKCIFIYEKLCVPPQSSPAGRENEERGRPPPSYNHHQPLAPPTTTTNRIKGMKQKVEKDANRFDRWLSCSQMIITTRKNDGEMEVDSMGQKSFIFSIRTLVVGHTHELL